MTYKISSKKDATETADVFNFFDAIEYENHRQVFLEMERSEKDLFILSFFHFHLDESAKEDRMKFYLTGQHLCKTMKRRSSL